MLEIIQHNCRRSGSSFATLMQVAVERGADLVLVQEPPVCQLFTQQGYNILWTKGRVCTAIRKGQSWSASLVDRLTREGGGDVQVLEIRNSEGELGARVANVYMAPIFGSTGRERPGEGIDWTGVLEDGKGIMGGDFNCHSSRWDHREERERGRDADWTIGVIDEFDLRIINNGTSTYHRHDKEKGLYESVIDLTLAGDEVRVSNYKVLKGYQGETGSDHRVISWRIDIGQGHNGKQLQEMGWDIGSLMKDKELLNKTRKSWEEKIGRTPSLRDDATREELEVQAERIQECIIGALDEHAKKVRICARSKRWWNEDIAKERREAARARKEWQQARTEEAWENYKGCRNSLVAAIRRARKEHWEAFLGESSGEDLWTVIRYTRGRRSGGILPALSGPDGTTAETSTQKARILADISFPPPALYQGDEGEPGEDRGAHEQVRNNPEMVRRALFSQRSRKAPGPDRLGAPILRLLYGWDQQRIIDLVVHSFRLGVHPRVWKVARGVPIPKPKRQDYGLAKNYRTISLLNCLGKVVERVATELLSQHCEGEETLHEGQFGARRRRSAVEAVGRLIGWVESGWQRKEITGALCMDVAAAFPSVARGCLLRKMRNMGLEENLVEWMDSFMSDSRVIMSIDGQDDGPREVTTGLPQGSPILPVLSATYTEISAAV